MRKARLRAFRLLNDPLADIRALISSLLLVLFPALGRPVWSRCFPKWDRRAMGMGLLGPARLGTPGAAGLDAGCQAGGGCTDGSCAWGTDGLCAWVTNDLGTDVLASAAAPSGGGASLGRDRPGTRADDVARWRMLG